MPRPNLRRRKATNHHDLALLISDRARELEAHTFERGKEVGGVSKLSTDEAVERDVLEAIGVNMIVPKGSYAVELDSCFVWLDRQQTRLKGSNNHDVQLGIFIHSEPYTGPEQFSLKYLLDRRDEVTNTRVHGPTEGSFMSVERRMLPTYEEININGEIAAEIRGLWRMENDFMGGLFASLTMYDEASSS